MVDRAKLFWPFNKYMQEKVNFWMAENAQLYTELEVLQYENKNLKEQIIFLQKENIKLKKLLELADKYIAERKQ